MNRLALRILAVAALAQAGSSPSGQGTPTGRRRSPPIDIKAYRHPVPYNRSMAAWKGDGFDEERIAKAQAKRDRRAKRPQGRS